MSDFSSPNKQTGSSIITPRTGDFGCAEDWNQGSPVDGEKKCFGIEGLDVTWAFHQQVFNLCIKGYSWWVFFSDSIFGCHVALPFLSGKVCVYRWRGASTKWPWHTLAFIELTPLPPFLHPLFSYVAAASLIVFLFKQANLRTCNYSHWFKWT